MDRTCGFCWFLAAESPSENSLGKRQEFLKSKGKKKKAGIPEFIQGDLLEGIWILELGVVSPKEKLLKNQEFWSLSLAFSGLLVEGNIKSTS